jgi:hypothetical protein
MSAGMNYGYGICVCAAMHETEGKRNELGADPPRLFRFENAANPNSDARNVNRLEGEGCPADGAR